MKKPALEVTDEDFDRIVHTNLNAVFSLTRACAGRMIERGSGSIIMISSMAAYYGIDRVAAYAASKAGVEGMVKVLASEFSGKGVRVNAIAPGFIETDMTRSLTEKQQQYLLQQIPLGRLGQVEEVAAAVAFFASPAAGYITGATLHLNGGMYMD